MTNLELVSILIWVFNYKIIKIRNQNINLRQRIENKKIIHEFIAIKVLLLKMHLGTYFEDHLQITAVSIKF